MCAYWILYIWILYLFALLFCYFRCLFDIWIIFGGNYILYGLLDFYKHTHSQHKCILIAILDYGLSLVHCYTYRCCYAIMYTHLNLHQCLVYRYKVATVLYWPYYWFLFCVDVFKLQNCGLHYFSPDVLFSYYFVCSLTMMLCYCVIWSN